MQYLLLIYEAEQIWENKTDDEKRAVLAQHHALGERLGADGAFVSASPLMPTLCSVLISLRCSDPTRSSPCSLAVPTDVR